MTHIIRNIWCHLKWIYLARAVELSGFELRQTISFALLIVITIVHTSSKRQAVIVNTCIPVLVFFNKLKTEFSSGDWIWTHLAITNRIFAIVTTIQAVGFAWTIWNDSFKVFDWILLPFKHSVLSLEHWLIQRVSLSQSKMHSIEMISHRSLQATFRSGTLNISWSIIYMISGFLRSMLWIWKTYKHSVNGSKSSSWPVTKVRIDIKK